MVPFKRPRARPGAEAPQRELPLHLQVLLPSPVWLSAADFARTLGEVHPSLAQMRVEMRMAVGGALPGGPRLLAQVRWAQHTVQVAFLDLPAPRDLLEQTIEPALYEDALKAQAEAHTAHAILLYRGEERDPLEQYRALAKISVGLVRLGATLVLNPDACTSYPAGRLAPQPGEELDEVLRTLPLMALFIGFVTLKVEGHDGFWVRTCGAPRLDMPDLALHTDDAREVQTIFLIFQNIFDAMRDSGVRFGPGDRVDDGERHWRFRKPRADEPFLDSPWMIVLEPAPPAGPLS